MCQVTPFTLPCCRRIYVSVEKLPSCPSDWPRKKCPKELIVQISGYEPKDVQHRNQGICWRCLADRAGKSAWEREELRPVLDGAFVVEGLEEWTIEERRVRVEAAGLCWHCGADRRCANCGSGRVRFSGEKEVLEIKGKRGRGETAAGKEKKKRLKVDQAGSSMSTPSFMASSPYFQQRQTDPLLQQCDLSSGSVGTGLAYHQFTQGAPTFNYQPQEMQFHSPITQNASSNWQDIKGSQSYETSGQSVEHFPIDPALYQQQEEQQAKQNSDLALRQQQTLAQIPGFSADIVDLVFSNEIEDETIDRLLKEYQEEVLKSEEENNTITQITTAPQIHPALGSAQHHYPAPTESAVWNDTDTKLLYKK